MSIYKITEQLRFVTRRIKTSDNTGYNAKILQRQLQNVVTGELKWEDVPTEIEEDGNTNS